MAGSEAVPAVAQKDHWDDMARHLSQFIRRISTTELEKLYIKLVADGWNSDDFPFDPDRPEGGVKRIILDAILHETVVRSEGRYRR